MTIVRGPHTVSAHADADGNYRALNPRYPHSIGYGRTPEEASENLTRAIFRHEQANPLALVEAAFMQLSDVEQTRFVADVPRLRRS